MFSRSLSSFIFFFIFFFGAVFAAVLVPTDGGGELPNTYIVIFRSNLSESLILNHTAWIRSLETVDNDGAVVRGLRHEFSLAFNGYSAVFDDELLAKVQATEGVEEVRSVGVSVPPRVFATTEHDDELVSTSSYWLNDERGPASVLTDANKGWNANRITHRTFKQTNYDNGPWIHDGYLGQGVTVYLLDSGINLANPGFKGSNVVHGKNMVKGAEPSDKNGHGTMCAGVIAGSLHGLSPNAKTINVKVANDQDRSACDDVVAGIEWVVKEPGENNMKVISMSQTGFTGRPDVYAAVAAAVKKGVHVVVCAGNNDVDACNVEPSNAPGAIVVGSIEPNGKFPTKKSSPEGTNVGKCVTLFAPGSRVPTLSAKNITPGYKYFAWGTSIAAPQVAALIANRLSKVGPQAPGVIEQWLKDTATKGQVKGTNGDLRGSPDLIAFSGVGGEGVQRQTVVQAPNGGNELIGDEDAVDGREAGEDEIDEESDVRKMKNSNRRPLA